MTTPKPLDESMDAVLPPPDDFNDELVQKNGFFNNRVKLFSQRRNPNLSQPMCTHPIFNRYCSMKMMTPHRLHQPGLCVATILGPSLILFLSALPPVHYLHRASMRDLVNIPLALPTEYDTIEEESTTDVLPPVPRLST